MRVALYVRTASQEQTDEAWPLAMLEQALVEYVQRHGHKVVGVYRDVSASPMDRPAYQDMMNAARQGLFDAILVQTFDRLSRKQDEAVALQERLRRECGVDVIAVGQTRSTI